MIRGVRYVLVEPFYKFWFRYIYPNMDLIDIGRGDQVREIILEDIPNHIGLVFEDIVRETLLAISGKKILDISIQR